MTNTPNFTALAQQMSTKRAELNVLMEQFKDKMKAEFVQLTRFFFEETGIEAVIWNQYTPAFNDGDPCEFTLGEAVFVRKNFLTNEEVGEDYDVEYDLMSADEYESDFYDPVPVGYVGRKNEDPMTAVCDVFQGILNDNMDILESLYGNYGTTVYLTKDKVYEAEYDCGY